MKNSKNSRLRRVVASRSRAGWAIFLGVMCGAVSLSAAPNLIFDWGVRESATTTLNPDIEHIPHPASGYPALHVYNQNVWLTADASNRVVGLMLKNDTGPYDGTKPDTLATVIGWMSTNHITLDYAFADVETETTYDNTVEMVNIVRNHADPRINQSRLIQYAYYPGAHDESKIWTQTTNRVVQHQEYMTSGVDVANPNCYPYEQMKVHASATWGSYQCPDKRSALFWAPLERFSVAKRNLPAGHQIIPWIAGFVLWEGYDAPEPTPEDKRALLQHMRLRGADGYYRLADVVQVGGAVDPAKEILHRAEMLDAWHALDDFFATPGAAEILTLDTDKTSGVNWSAVRKGTNTVVLISNLSSAPASVDFPPDIPELPDISETVPAGTHVFYEYDAINPPVFYTLTVQVGSGDGSYEEDEVATITATPPPPDAVFARWTGDVGALVNPNAAATTLLHD